jgi:hypothetical protein
MLLYRTRLIDLHVLGVKKVALIVANKVQHILDRIRSNYSLRCKELGDILGKTSLVTYEASPRFGALSLYI